MDLRDVIRGNGSVRSFTDEPVDDATLHAVLDDARFAPSGGNRQGWRIAIVTDPVVRRQLGDLMQPVWNAYTAQGATGITPFNVVDAVPADPAAPHASNPLLEAIETVPVVLAVAADLRCLALMDGDLGRPPITGGASIYPFCWNLLLAARAHGLGGVMTTFLSKVEPAAAPLLSLPEHHVLAATIFLGHPVHQPTKLRRNPVESFARRDTFAGEPFAP